MRKYEITLSQERDESGAYWVACNNLFKEVVGCGDTPEEAVKELEDNIDFYQEYLKENKEENPILREKQGFCFKCKKFTNIKIEKITRTTQVGDIDITCDKYLGICESCGECCSNENIQRYNDFLVYKKFEECQKVDKNE